MIPQGVLAPIPSYNTLLPPDNIIADITFTTDVQLGGIGLSNGNSGLEYQFWYLEVVNPGESNSYIAVSAPNTPWTTIVTTSGITWARLAFDQNMHPTISFMDNTGNHLFWWDPTIPGNAILNLPSYATYPCVTMDDKRNTSTLLGSNDIILGYVGNNDLMYRQERDRYGIEYTLYSNVNTLVANPFLNKIGMDVNYKLQFQIGGQLYQ